MYKPKILVVEDDPAINNLIRTTLETQEYQYHTAQNGSGALMEVLSYKPDVVILDLGLPDMDGVEHHREDSQLEQYSDYCGECTHRGSGQGGGPGCWGG